MKTRCDGNLNGSMLAEASFFYKRFAKLKFLKKHEQDKVIEDVKTELELVEEKSKSEGEVSKNNNSEPAKKKKRFLGPVTSDSEDEGNMTTVEKELLLILFLLLLFLLLLLLLLLLYRRAEYLIMARLARKYLAVQGTSTGAERVISRLGLILTKRWLAMKGELFSKVMFLCDCL